MPLPEEPHKVIAPILSIDRDTRASRELWGTAFFLTPTVIMSVKHALGERMLDTDQMIIADLLVSEEDPRARLYQVADVYLDPRFDVAVGVVPNWPHGEQLRLAPSDQLGPLNQGVLSTEYSEVDFHASDPEGRPTTRITPTFHMGHVLRTYVSDIGQNLPTKLMDVSFPALKRSSGAPILHGGSGEVEGMIVGNVARQLAPAHVERVVHGEQVMESISYQMPQGLAIRASHLRDALEAAAVSLGFDMP